MVGLSVPATLTTRVNRRNTRPSIINESTWFDARVFTTNMLRNSQYNASIAREEMLVLKVEGPDHWALMKRQQRSHEASYENHLFRVMSVVYVYFVI